jgi:hypothetical protein
MIWLHAHPFPPCIPSVSSTSDHTGRPRKSDNLLTGEVGEGVGLEPSHSHSIIQYSLLLPLPPSAATSRLRYVSTHFSFAYCLKCFSAPLFSISSLSLSFCLNFLSNLLSQMFLFPSLLNFSLSFSLNFLTFLLSLLSHFPSL